MEVKYYALEKYEPSFDKWQIIKAFNPELVGQCMREFNLLNDYGDGCYRVLYIKWDNDLGWIEEVTDISIRYNWIKGGGDGKK